MTNAAAASRIRTPKRFEFEGQIISTRSGHVTVELQWTQVAGQDVFYVSVNTGVGAPVDTASYDDEQTARDEAHRIVLAYAPSAAFPNGPSPAQLAERHDALGILIVANERRYGPEAARRASLYRSERDAIQPLAGRAWDAAMVADIRQHLAAA